MNLNPAKGGRTGRVEFIAACRRMAIEDGTTLEAAIWEGVKGVLHRAAMDGDAKALETVLKWVARYDPDGAEGKGATVEVTNQTLNLSAGPAPPDDLSAYVEEVKRIQATHVSTTVDELLE